MQPQLLRLVLLLLRAWSSLMISWTPWQALLRLLRVLRPALRLLHA